MPGSRGFARKPSSRRNGQRRDWRRHEARAAIADELFDRLPYGLFAVEESGTIVEINDACRELFAGLLGAADTSDRSLRCCDLVCDAVGEETGGRRCFTEEALTSAAPLPEARIDLPHGSFTDAAWVTTSRLAESGLVVFHLRPGESSDQRRHTEGTWLTTPRLRIFALGQTRLETREGPAGGDWLEQRPGQLLKYLVSRRGDFVAAEEIAEAFWPESGGMASLASVRYLVHTLRSRLEPNRQTRAPSTFVRSRRGGYMLDSRCVWIDADEFEELVSEGLTALVSGEREAACNRLRRAIALYHGDFLADEPYAEWALAERDRLSELAGRALRALIELGVATSDLDSAASHARRLADMEPYDEDAQRRHIELCITRGRRTEAVRRYTLFRRRMLRAFDEEPKFELAELSN
jgi:DNA-binding SARP family transcriptional activator